MFWIMPNHNRRPFMLLIQKANRLWIIHPNKTNRIFSCKWTRLWHRYRRIIIGLIQMISHVAKLKRSGVRSSRIVHFYEIGFACFRKKWIVQIRKLLTLRGRPISCVKSKKTTTKDLGKNLKKKDSINYF